MLKNLFLAIYQDGNIYDTPDTINFGKALLISLVAILIVFVVLVIIIGAVKLLQVVYAKVGKKETAEVKENNASPVEEVKNTTIEDEDMMVAALIATIDYSSEVKTDVKLKSIKRIG